MPLDEPRLPDFQQTLSKGESLFQEGKWQAALEVFQSLLERDPGNLTALNNQGVVLTALGFHEQAVRIFEQILTTQPDRPDTIFNLITRHGAAHDWARAEELLSGYGRYLPETEREKLWSGLYEAKYAVPGHTFLKCLPLTVHTPAHHIEIQLMLDTGRLTQKMMWEHLIRQRLYEANTLQFICQVLKPGDGFVDIGAHVGYFSVIAAALAGKQGKVIAIEPDADNYDLLLKNLNLNRADHVAAFNLALSSREGSCDFFINTDNDGGHALWDVSRHPYNEKSRINPITRKTPTRTLERLLDDGAPLLPKVIKIDTEGAELRILEGGRRYLADIPHVICEINQFGLKQMGDSEEALRDLMHSLGFECYLFSDSGPGLRKQTARSLIDSPYIYNLLFTKSDLAECDF